MKYFSKCSAFLVLVYCYINFYVFTRGLRGPVLRPSPDCLWLACYHSRKIKPDPAFPQLGLPQPCPACERAWPDPARLQPTLNAISLQPA